MLLSLWGKERTMLPWVSPTQETLLHNPFLNNPWFLRVCSTSPLITLLKKEKLLITSNFSFSHSVFYPLGELPAIFIRFKVVVCKLFRFGKLLKFVIWERVNWKWSWTKSTWCTYYMLDHCKHWSIIVLTCYTLICSLPLYSELLCLLWGE